MLSAAVVTARAPLAVARHADPSTATEALSPAQIPGAGQRVLVFAPHPDDETLGVGGLLHEARQRGADIRVVFFTNGDGFPLCAAAQYRRWPDASQLQRLAEDRRREARTALDRLGIAADAVTFLGYPDRGLDSLWLRNWSSDRPFRSPYTHVDSVPAGMFRPHAPYSGEAVLADVQTLLRTFRPDVLYYPDPADDHPDHWAAHCFVQLALEQAQAAGQPLPKTRRTYLIHRGMWPSPMARKPEWPLSPPEELQNADVRWERVDLSPAAVDAKRRALNAYGSQLQLAGNFLTAFLRRNELLSEWPVATPDPFGREAPPGPASRSREMRLIAHSAVPTLSEAVAGISLNDSTADRFARARLGAIDFTRMEVEQTAADVTLRARTRTPLLAWPSYVIYVKSVGGGGFLPLREYRFTGYRSKTSGVRYTLHGNSLEVTVPRRELGVGQRLLVSVAAWGGPVQLDRTPWRVIDLSPPSSPETGTQ